MFRQQSWMLYLLRTYRQQRSSSQTRETHYDDESCVRNCLHLPLADTLSELVDMQAKWTENSAAQGLLKRFDIDLMLRMSCVFLSSFWTENFITRTFFARSFFEIFSIFIKTQNRRNTQIFLMGKPMVEKIQFRVNRNYPSRVTFFRSLHSERSMTLWSQSGIFFHSFQNIRLYWIPMNLEGCLLATAGKVKSNIFSPYI